MKVGFERYSSYPPMKRSCYIALLSFFTVFCSPDSQPVIENNNQYPDQKIPTLYIIKSGNHQNLNFMFFNALQQPAKKMIMFLAPVHIIFKSLAEMPVSGMY